jgi:hypothetical protein
MRVRLLNIFFLLILLSGCACVSSNCVTCGSVQEIARDGRFIAYNDGTVLDTSTNLMWAATDNGSDISWAAAKFYCESYRAGHYDDWRLPTLEELEELYDESKSYPAKCNNSNSIHLATKLIDVSCFYAWGLETNGTTSESIIFDFGAGIQSAFASQMTYFMRVIPVRSR